MMPNVVVKAGHEVDRLSLWKPDEPTVPGTCLWAHQLCDSGRVPSPSEPSHGSSVKGENQALALPEQGYEVRRPGEST